MESPNEKDLAEEYVLEWIDSTIKIIGSIMKKRRVKFTDPSRQNIRIELAYRAKGILDLTFYYRDSLRFTDMGAGKGYSKGKRISSADYRSSLSTRRKRKKILMKPIYSRLAALQNVVASELAYLAEIQFDTNLS